MTTDIDWKARAEAAEADNQKIRTSRGECYRELDVLTYNHEKQGRWVAELEDALRGREAVIEELRGEAIDAAARIADLEARLARVPDREAVALETMRDLLASLVAATSLARHAKKAAPSNTMHAMMIADYEKSAERGRAAIAAMQETAQPARVPDREAVARAMYEQCGAFCLRVGWNDLYPGERETWAQRADAVLAAMQETKL